VASAKFTQETFPLDELQFPRRCLECDGQPEGAHEMTLKVGSLRLRVPAPYCDRCAKRLSGLRLRWHLSWIGATVAFVGLIAFLQRTAYFDEHNGQLGLIAVPGLVVLFWWSMLRETQAFHERYSRIWIKRFVTAPRDARTITLASKEPKLLRAIAKRSGAAED